MTELNLTIRQEHRINGVPVFFNPTDMSFAESLYKTFDAAENIQNEYKEKSADAAEPEQVFALMRELDTNIRSLIDTLFDDDVSGRIFGTVNVYALSDGLPLWVNLLMAIIDLMDDTFMVEKEKGDPRLAKYREKYNQKKGSK